jgi:prophage maintenance system killer protein
VQAAALATARIATAQAFTEGNKRTALLIGLWILDRNGEDGARIMPPADPELARLLLDAARGTDIRDAVFALLAGRR